MPAFKIGALDGNKLQIDLMDYFLCVANLTGIPGISIPCGMTQNKLPIGLQLLGPHRCEELMLQTAHAFEQATAWHTERPPLFN
jgi:aspartyl-tRNA(Asn)/glutamyl-tRNA(Gln) amidotransferase subunit A